MELHNSNPKRDPDHDFEIWKLQRRWDNILVRDYIRKGKPFFNNGTYTDPKRATRMNKKERRLAKKALAIFNELQHAV